MCKIEIDALKISDISLAFCLVHVLKCVQRKLVRADQNKSGALLEFPMRTAMHGKSRVSSAIFVCNN